MHIAVPYLWRDAATCNARSRRAGEAAPMLPPATAGPRQWRTEAGQLTRDQIDAGREEKAGGAWCMGSEIQLEGAFCKISRLTITPHRAPLT